MRYLILVLLLPGIANADLSLGYIANSYHFDQSDDKNETHNGIYLKYGYGLIGAYKNTHHEQSVFIGQGKDARGQTFSMTGPARMVTVYKCISCGWSVR